MPDPLPTASSDTFYSYDGALYIEGRPPTTEGFFLVRKDNDNEELHLSMKQAIEAVLDMRLLRIPDI